MYFSLHFRQLKFNNLTTDVICTSGPLQHFKDTARVDDFDNDSTSINIKNWKKVLPVVSNVSTPHAVCVCVGYFNFLLIYFF